MLKINLVIFNLFAISFLFVSTVNAQTTKEHTQKMVVNNSVDIHVNTSHANVKFESWDKNEVEVTFTMEAPENIEEQFKKWQFDVSGNKEKVTISSQSNFEFDMEGFEFDMGNFELNMEGFEFNMDELDIELGELNLDNIDIMVSDMITDLNINDMPVSPFGKDVDFDSDTYQKDPDAYLKKMNSQHDTQVTKSEVDAWMDKLDEWSEEFEVRVENSFDFEKLEEQTKKYEERVKTWEQENREKIKQMTEQIEQQMEKMNFEQFENFNYFDQENSDVKKTILIKIPKNAKLHLNIRYGEVTLAENLRNINAELNYASLTAKSINGNSTDISASFAPVYVNHWQDGHLSLNHCQNITIQIANKIALESQGTDIFIGTLLNSGRIKSAYGDLEINKIDPDFDDLSLTVDYGKALIYLDPPSLDIEYEGVGKSTFSLPENWNVTSDITTEKHRTVKAFYKKPNTGKVLAVNTNYGNLTIK
jgi:hypothetical protein